MIWYSFLVKVAQSEALYTSSRNLNSKKTAKLSRKHEKHEEQRTNKQFQHLRGNNRTWNIMTSCNLRVLPLLKTWVFTVQLTLISNTISRCSPCIFSTAEMLYEIPKRFNYIRFRRLAWTVKILMWFFGCWRLGDCWSFEKTGLIFYTCMRCCMHLRAKR